MDVLSKADTDQASERLMQLERQLERGYKFSHSVIGESMLRTSELQVLLHGLIDTLLAKGITTEDELLSAMHKVRAELAERDELNWQRAMIRDESPTEPETVSEVDCQARLHLCKSACCKLDFALSVRELEEAEVKWDLGRPYFIRHDSNGYCSHLDCDSGNCNIYDKRPGVCRNYSCAKDQRIWLDFDKMEINQEWIDANLIGITEPALIDVFMHDRAQLKEASNKTPTTADEVNP
jgi:Fe-S-cluster containining protein